MEKLPRQFVKYTSELSGQPIIWRTGLLRSLPQYLARHYELYEITVAGRRFLGIFLKDDADFRPSAFAKHLRHLLVVAQDTDSYCLVARDLPSYVRQRLIERQIPFVVPGRQLYWPELGLAVQARKIKGAPVPVAAVSPATQAVLIWALMGKLTAPITPKSLAKKLGYSTMTLSRALDEIEANSLGQVGRKGRERLLDFPAGRPALWRAALPFMRNPVREVVRIRESLLPPTGRLKAGETALASLSMLVPPQESVYALGRPAWKSLARQVDRIPVEDEGTCCVQIWRYEPALFARAGRVDCFSLYRSLQDEPDERVQTALEEMMEHVAWS